jgi:hypothetical protein
MLLCVIKASHCGDYKLLLTFNSGETRFADLEKTLMNETRQIFFPLRDKEYFRKFTVRFNTVAWENEADFAPEFLYDISTPAKAEAA